MMIIKETGWTRKYLLWGESWFNIQMMLADAPAYRSSGNKDEVLKEPDSLEEFEKYFG